MTSYNLTRFTTPKTEQQKTKILEAVEILSRLGIPLEQLFTFKQWRRVERLALVLLSLGDVRPDTPWLSVKSREDSVSITTRNIIDFINQHYSESISKGSYDDFKRKEIDLLLPDSIVIPGFVERSAVNDSRSGYAICSTHVEAIRKFGTPDWDAAVESLLARKVSLREQLDTRRNLSMISITLPAGLELSFTPGNHNELQKAIIEQFLPRYGCGCEVLYIGDSSDKYLYLNREKLLKLGFPEPKHEELPDIIAFSEQQGWIYLIESVTSFGEISQIRKIELERITKKCTNPIIFVTAFPNRATYRKYCANLAWETEVWIASDPDHLIHLNGSKFLGPYLKVRDDR
jgi:BsuBI/PstI restriction endonuclease domain/BsuBI/PstI restriction endonuclease HTH domain